MEYFIHSSTASYSKDLKKLVSEHGLAGLGFFWMAVEKLILSNMPIPLTDLVRRGFKGLSRTQATDIVINSGLFHYDENEMVSLAEKVDYGIDKKSLKTYFVKLSLCAPACECVAPRVAECVAECVAPRVAAGHCKLNKEKKREENIARETFFIFMEENCRHLLEMAEPLTLDEYRELKKWYTPEQIQEVFIDMENDIGLNKRRRNCFQTAFSWLKKRFGNPQNVSAKGSGKVFCGLDEYGTPIYKNQSNNKNNQNNNNGKQDSNSAVCAADAEQQGDGGGSAEWPDE
jgi:hypothetical protein